MTRSLPLWANRFLQHSVMLAVCLGLTLLAGCRREEPPKVKEPGPGEEIAAPGEGPLDDTKATSGLEVVNRMITAYRKATSYADAGEVHLTARANGETIIDETANFSLTLDHPNQIRAQAYQAMLVCNGKNLYAAIQDLPGQVLERRAPTRVTMKTLYSDRILAMALSQGIGGALPQALLLLANEPIKALLGDDANPALLEPKAIEGRDCYRVRVERPEGAATFWVDQESFILRRVVLPTDEISRAISQTTPVDHVSLVAEFRGASIDGVIDPKAFEFEIPEGAEIVRFFVPPHTAQLLSKKAPDFRFVDLDGEPITPESLAGKITVLDFWATWCGPCKQSLPKLQKVYEQFKDNPKVAFYAVSVDRPDVNNKEMAKLFEDLKVTIPILRDTEQSAAAFKFTGIPTSFIIGVDGIVQDYEVGGNPKLTEELPEKIEKLLAGENIYEEPLRKYQEQLDQYAKMLEKTSDSELVPDGPIVEERQLPETKTAERSEPASLKLTPLWKCTEVQSPGNILAFHDKDGTPRLAVVEYGKSVSIGEIGKSVAEIGLDGKLIALHKLDIAENEIIGSLRTNVGADGKRYTVAFLSTQQRCHLLDENWNLLVSYPKDALDKPHSGIADVELGDLDGDGTLEMYVSYWGVVGVQGVSLEGERLWANRSLSNAVGMAIGAPDDKGRRNLYCTNSTGSLVVLDAEGQRQGEVTISGRMLHWIAAADLRGNGQLSWSGMTAPKPGENVAIGLSLDGDALWNYALPTGVQRQPIEPIIPGRVTREGPGQWIFPSPDGSIHILAADGAPLDTYNSGVMLQGLATVEIDGQPALIISSADGVEAWKVE